MKRVPRSTSDIYEYSYIVQCLEECIRKNTYMINGRGGKYLVGKKSFVGIVITKMHSSHDRLKS